MLTNSIENILIIVAESAKIAIIIRIITSYVQSLRISQFGEIIYKITDPILAPCRMLLDKIGFNGGMFDISPIIAFLLIDIIANILLVLI